jgi:hypothetical protein
MKMGFLTVMAALTASVFKSRSKHDLSDPYQPEAPIPTGEVHIRSYGKKRPMVWIEKLHDPERINRHGALVAELKAQGIVWHNNKLYWESRKVMEENK